MTPMTHIADAPPLLTDADVLDRVTELVGPAAVRRQLWVLFLERRGPDVATADDGRWAEQLATGCGDVVLDGV